MIHSYHSALRFTLPYTILNDLVLSSAIGYIYLLASVRVSQVLVAASTDSTNTLIGHSGPSIDRTFDVRSYTVLKILAN